MSVLVTGGAGYIGSHTVRALQERGEPVVVIDRLDHGGPPPTGAPLVVGDVRDEELVGEVLARHRVDAILHFAARKSAPDSLEDPGGCFDDNVAGSMAVLRAAVRHGARAFVLSSTCAVYGTPDELPVSERLAVRPENPYGESKAAVERMLPWFGRAHGLRHAALRYFNAAGAHPAGDLGEDWDHAPNLVPAVLRAAFAGRPVHVFGTALPTPDGTAIRDYVHVMDLADAHLAALDRLRAGADGLVVNLGTGQGYSVAEVVAAARRITGRRIDVVEEPPRDGDPAAVWADASRARAVLGWSASRDLDDMLRTAWRAGLRLHGHPAGEATTGAGARVPVGAAPVLAQPERSR